MYSAPARGGRYGNTHLTYITCTVRCEPDSLPSLLVYTQSAVLEAMAAPRDVCEPLVQAYLARRALDYLVGFTLSPVLWRKVPGCRSAGRVQSVALRLVCEREKAYERFVPKEFWTVHATLQVIHMQFPCRVCRHLFVVWLLSGAGGLGGWAGSSPSAYIHRLCSHLDWATFFLEGR